MQGFAQEDGGVLAFPLPEARPGEAIEQLCHFHRGDVDGLRKTLVRYLKIFDGPRGMFLLSPDYS